MCDEITQEDTILPFQLEARAESEDCTLNTYRHQFYATPIEADYFAHSKFYLHLRSSRRLNEAIKLLKISPHTSVRRQLNQLNEHYHRMMHDIFMDATFQHVWSLGQYDNGIIVECDKQEIIKDILQNIYSIDKYYRLDSAKTLQNFVDDMWTLITRSTKQKPLISLCCTNISRDLLQLPDVLQMEKNRGLLNVIGNHECFKSTFNVGSSGCIFGAKVADPGLITINFLHFGTTRVWYVIPPSHFVVYCRYSSKIFCKNINVNVASMMIIPPDVLRRLKIPYTTISQNPGDIIYIPEKAIYYCLCTGPCLDETVSCATENWANDLLNLPLMEPYNTDDKEQLKRYLRRN